MKPIDNGNNSPLKFDVKASKIQGLNNQLTNIYSTHKNSIQRAIVELSDGLGELKQSPNVGPVEKCQIAAIEDLFFKLFHQFVGIDNIREYASHKPGDRTPLDFFWRSDC
jgi:hypothetical protein